jgi:hypothetical protein
MSLPIPQKRRRSKSSEMRTILLLLLLLLSFCDTVINPSTMKLLFEYLIKIDVALFLEKNFEMMCLFFLAAKCKARFRETWQ